MCVLLAHLLGMVPLSVMESHHMLKPTLTMVLDRKIVNTTRELISRLRKALKTELQTGRADIEEDKSCAVSAKCLHTFQSFLWEHKPVKLKHCMIWLSVVNGVFQL